eukprot:scaffold14504_cov78-Skeletonema_dohrnii-CCMP3373.AAC.1
MAANASAMRMLNALDVMIAELMNADGSTNTNSLETIIKVFLDACVDFSTHLEKRKKKKKKNQTAESATANSFFVKGNFISLLNLPLQIMLFGSLLLMWDGNLEKGIQVVKPGLTKLRKTAQFLATKLERVRADEYFEIIKDRWYGFFGMNDNTKLDRFHGMHRYSNEDDIITRLRSGEPTSFFQLRGSLFIAFGKAKSRFDINVVRVEFDVLTPNEKLCGLTYSKLLISEKAVSLPSQSFDEISDYGVLLPLVEKNDFGGYWTIITDERKGLLSTLELGRKAICSELFINCFPPTKMGVEIVGRHIAMVYRYSEHDRDGNQTSEGICYYSGTISRWLKQDRYIIVWDGKSTEASQESLDMEHYGASYSIVHSNYMYILYELR